MKDLDPLLSPKSIAVVGASKKESPGRQVIKNLEQLGFSGEVYPVNPKYDEVMGRRCFSSLEEIGTDIDLVAIMLGNEMVLPTLKEAAEQGVRAAWAFASGFAESGEEGAKLQKKIVGLCRENNILFHGPNCVGYVNLRDGVGGFSAPLSPGVNKGNVGAVMQSGSLSMAVANGAVDLGFSYIVSSGNESQLNSSDYISYMINDSFTYVVIAFIEEFRNTEKLREVASEAERENVPIIVLKVGQSDIAKEATQAHTAAIAGSDEAYEAFFEKRGIIRVSDLDEMFQTAKLFSMNKNKSPEGEGVGVLTLSGGEVSLIGDACKSMDLDFPDWSEGTYGQLEENLPDFIDPKNPLDAWGTGVLEETYPVCMDAVSTDPNVDVIVGSLNASGELADRQVEQFEIAADSLVEAAEQVDKPVVAVSNVSANFDEGIRKKLEEGGVPFLRGTKEGFSAVEMFVNYGEFSRRKPTTGPDEEILGPEETEKLKERFYEPNSSLSEHRGKQLLDSYGISMIDEELVDDKEGAIQAAERLGYPVVMKVLSDDIRHKTDAGTVSLDIDEDEVADTYEKLLADARGYNPGAEVEGVLVQEMVTEKSYEVILGLSEDPDFGPLITFGLGGIFVELLEDVAFRLPPISSDSARRMIEETKGSRLLKGFRGEPAGDIDALVDAIVRFGKLASDWEGKISALDVNPLLVLSEGNGVVAVDSLVDFN